MRLFFYVHLSQSIPSLKKEREVRVVAENREALRTTPGTLVRRFVSNWAELTTQTF
jgi:hypothetical protein